MALSTLTIRNRVFAACYVMRTIYIADLSTALTDRGKGDFAMMHKPARDHPSLPVGGGMRTCAMWCEAKPLPLRTAI